MHTKKQDKKNVLLATSKTKQKRKLHETTLLMLYDYVFYLQLYIQMITFGRLTACLQNKRKCTCWAVSQHDRQQTTNCCSVSCALGIFLH